MPYVRSFSPWIAYAAGAAIADWRLGAAAGLAVAIAVLLADRRDGLDVLTAASATFFAVLVPTAVLDPESLIRPYAPALSLGLLGVVAATSVLARQPFTIRIAKQSTPAELWTTELFVRANLTISSVWAASFLVTAVICALVIHTDPQATPMWVGAEVVGFLVPIRFTASYRARLASRFATV